MRFVKKSRNIIIALCTWIIYAFRRQRMFGRYWIVIIKIKKKPPRTDAYRKPMDRNTVEYVIHIAYLYIILYVQKRVRVQKYISPHIDVLVKKSIGKLFRVERASMDCKGSNNDDNSNILPVVGQPKWLINWPKYMFRFFFHAFIAADGRSFFVWEIDCREYTILLIISNCNIHDYDKIWGQVGYTIKQF